MNNPESVSANRSVWEKLNLIGKIKDHRARLREEEEKIRSKYGSLEGLNWVWCEMELSFFRKKHRPIQWHTEIVVEKVKQVFEWYKTAMEN